MPMHEYLQDQVMTTYILGAEVRFYTVAPTMLTDGTELTDYTPADASLVQDEAILGLARNDAVVEITVPECDLAAIGLTDASGNLLMVPKVFDPPRSYASGQVVRIDPGEIVVDLRKG